MATTIDIRDNVSAALKALPVELSAAKLNPAIGQAEENLFHRWLESKPANKRGWTSTGFWQQLSRATNFNVLSDGVMISINHVAARQRYQGGEIHPTGGKKYLTIPARSEAAGKRAGDFNNLVLAFRREGGKTRAFALVEAAATPISFGRRRKNGSRKIEAGSTVGDAVMFWLVQSVTQKPDPTVIPPDEQMVQVAKETILDLISLNGGRS